MNIGYVFLLIITGTAFFVSGIPTPDQMVADFNAAQKFYTSGAYDQAIEKYAEVGNVESRFVDEDKVVVNFGDMQFRIKDATLYQSGNSYSKMAGEELRKASETQNEDEKEKNNRLALEYVSKATEYFNNTQEVSTNEELKVLAQKKIIDTWYLIYNHNKVIEEGRKLIEKYPESIYVQDALYNIGWAYYDTQKYDDSIITFNELITRFPTGTKSDRALFQIGESYFDQSNYSEAAPYYLRLVNKMRINELTDLEIQKIQRDKLAGLTDETALDLAAKAALKVGACFANSGQYDEAATTYKRIATLFRYDKTLIYEAYNRLSNMYFDKGDFDASIQAYRDAIDEVPDKIIAAKAQVLIAQRYFDGFEEQKFYESAINEYNNYIVSYSDVAFRAGFDLDEAFFALARSYYELGVQMLKNKQEDLGQENLEQAINTYLRLFKEFPSTTLTERVYFYLAMAYQETDTSENLNTSIETYNKLLEEFNQTLYKEYCYVKLARAFKSLKEYDTAISYFNKFVEEFPESQQLDSVWFEIGITVFEKGDAIGSVEYLLKVSRKNKKLFTTARLLSIQELTSSGRDSDVIETVTYAVEDPDAIESEYRLSQLYLMRGNSYKTLNNFEAAIADYTMAYDLNQPETRQIASVQRAGVYIEQEQFARAESDLRELMKSDNENIRRSAQLRLAIISVRQGKSAQAINTYLDLYNTTDDPEEKLGFLRNLIQLNATSDNWTGLEKYADMMINSEMAEGKKPLGQNFFYKEEAYYFLGNAYETQAKNNENIALENPITPEAIRKYELSVYYLLQGFDKFPDSYFSSDMLLKVGVMYLTKLNTLSDALDLAALYFGKYITNFPDTPNTEMAHYYLGFCYYNGRRFNDAINTFMSFARKYPNSEFTPEAVFYYSDGYYNVGNLEECIKGFDNMIQRYPRHNKAAEALYTKAWAYLDLESEDDAIATFQTLVDRYPKSEFASTALFSIADYFYNIQSYEEAILNYQRVLDEFPDTDVAEKVPETLKDLNETVAYIEYEKGWEIFSQAQDTKELALYEQALEIFKKISGEYPETESGIGAFSNMGICFEALGRWQNAIEAYDNVMLIYEEGGNVSDEAFNFASMHKNYIIANRL